MGTTQKKPPGNVKQGIFGHILVVCKKNISNQNLQKINSLNAASAYCTTHINLMYSCGRQEFANIVTSKQMTYNNCHSVSAEN